MKRFGVELRAEVAGDTLRGHAAVFGPMAELPGGWERLAPGAFDAVLAEPDTDVRALINHDPRLVLGRQSTNTLRLKPDDDGLAFEVDLPDTSYANDLRQIVARGDLSGASFGFIPGKTSSERAPDGRELRTHLSIKRLMDVSAVTFPAYEGAGVALRHVTFDRPSSLRTQLLLARHRALAHRRADPCR